MKVIDMLNTYVFLTYFMITGQFVLSPCTNNVTHMIANHYLSDLTLTNTKLVIMISALMHGLVSLFNDKSLFRHPIPGII